MLESVEKELKNIVPDFDDTKQYVLWLMHDYFDTTRLYSASTFVELFDENGNEIDISLFMPENTRLATKTAYPDETIYQTWLKRRGNMVRGIPLVFDDPDDMLKIRTAIIHWTIAKPAYSSGSMPGTRFITIDIKNNVTFDMSGDGHWFILGHLDTLFNREHISKKHLDEIEDYYDAGLCIMNYIIHGDCTTDKSMCHTNILGEHWMNNNSNVDAKCADEIIGYLERQSVKHLIELGMHYDMLRSADKNDIWFVDKYYYEKTITLKADTHGRKDEKWEIFK